MLTFSLSRRVVAGLFALCMLVTGTVAAVVPASASGLPEGCEYVNQGENEQGEIEWGLHCEDPGDEGNNGDSGNSEPRCDLSRQEAFGYEVAYCDNENSCYMFVPSRVYDDEDEWPDRPADVSEDAVYSNLACFDPDENLIVNEYIWYEPGQPSMPQEAWDAYGRLVVPSFDLAFSPPGRTVVELDTWFWASGPGDGVITGTSAAGLVAIGTPDRIEVDPGDGSGVLTCPWTTAESDTCAHSYARASVYGTATSDAGEPAYPGRARLVYSIHFEWNGEIIEIPEVPGELAGPWVAQAVPVAEIQSVVRH